MLLVGGHSVPLLKKVRYLGLHLDPHLTFSGHFSTVSGIKRPRELLALGRLMPNLGGPSQSKGALLISVVNSRLLYATSKWAKRSINYGVCRNVTIRSQRLAVFRVTRSYRTVSAEAALFLGGNSSGRSSRFGTQRELWRVRSKMYDPDRVGSNAEIREEERDVLLAAWSIR